MAVDSPSSPRPTIYHSPSSLGRGRQRRSSGRKSFASTSLPVGVESPRTPCPRDGDHFSVKTSFLPQWSAPEDVWCHLPHELQVALVNLQRAGAAVLTGYERLERHSEDDEGAYTTGPDEELLVQLDNSVSPLPLPMLPPMLRTDSDVSSSAILSSTSSGSGTPMSATTSMNSPVSPICLTPSDNDFQPKRRERSFSVATPLEPHNAYYAHELSQLRTECLPRLRHAVRQVQIEWDIAKRPQTIHTDHAEKFEAWWEEKKANAVSLSKKCENLSEAIGLPSNGIGWTAP